MLGYCEPEMLAVVFCYDFSDACLADSCQPYFADCASRGLRNQLKTTLNNGYLGSRIDEERSEMRYVMRIAEFRESSNL